MGKVKNEPVKYYNSNESLELKKLLIEENEKLTEEQKVLTTQVEEIYNNLLSLIENGKVNRIGQIKKISSKVNKLQKVTEKIEINNEKLELLNSEKLQKNSNIKKPRKIRYYSEEEFKLVKLILEKKYKFLEAKYENLNGKVDEIYNALLTLKDNDKLYKLDQLNKLFKLTDKLSKNIKKIEKYQKVLGYFEEGNRLNKHKINNILRRFKTREPKYYSEKESFFVKHIFQKKIDSMEQELEALTDKYINLGNQVKDFKEYKSIDEDKLKVKLEKISNKIAKTKDDRKATKLENKFNYLKRNQFKPLFGFIFHNKKRLVKQLFETSKKVDKLKAKIQRHYLYVDKLEKLAYEKLNKFQRLIRVIKNMNYKQQKVVFGILFILPWFIGFCLFFASPLFSTIWWSLNEMTLKAGGGYESTFIGFGNYSRLFTNVTLSGITFTEMLTTSVMNIAFNLPIIIIFSLFIAVLLNTKFKGHQIVKAMFFIPVVFNMTVINNTLNGVFGQMLNGDVGDGFALSGQFADFLFQIGIGNGLVEFLTDAVDRIFTIVNMSGIQIIIFIAALQSIPSHLYEAAKVEGATKYEMFWKITIPMVSPMILTNIVYTVVDSFATSQIIQFMTVNSQGTTMATNQPGLYSAISIIFFLTNALIILFIFGLFKGVVFYYDDK